MDEKKIMQLRETFVFDEGILGGETDSNLTEDQNPIFNPKGFEQTIINSICNLDIFLLMELKEGVQYSGYSKAELILEFGKFFSKLKENGISKLVVKNSKCFFCYQHLNAYSFHDPETDEFIRRYVIGTDELGDENFVVKICIYDRPPDDGGPF